jgi:hypothetical protein
MFLRISPATFDLSSTQHLQVMKSTDNHKFFLSCIPRIEAPCHQTSEGLGIVDLLELEPLLHRETAKEEAAELELQL